MTGRKRRKRRKHLLSCFILFLTAAFGLITVCFFVKDRLAHKVCEETSSPSDASVNLKELNSKAGILVDAETGKIIAGKNETEKIYPASLTKIMTAILAIEKLNNLDNLTTISGDIFPLLYAQDASVAGFQPGESASYRELLYGALLPSGAECCLTLAIAVAGSEESFVNEMNQKAEALDMKNTHFVNSTGLHDKEHYTTVRDLSILLAYALKNQEFYNIFTAQHFSTAPSNVHPEGFTFYSTMVQEMDRSGIQNKYILGGKTGYTSKAGLCLASLGKVGERSYILVTAEAPGSHDTEPYHILDALKVYQEISKL